MDSRIEQVRDLPRGCGWRKTGGTYLMGAGTGYDCGLLPIPFKTCPCCGFGVRPSRQPTWVDADQLIYLSRDLVECPNPASYCAECPLNQLISGERELGMALLIWIGERHYPSILDFEREAVEQGISRRVQSVPRGFEVGETWVFLAHPKGIPNRPEMGEEVEWTPAIFHVFKPTRIEYICSGDESEEVIDDYIERGLTPVVIERVEPQSQELWEDDG